MARIYSMSYGRDPYEARYNISELKKTDNDVSWFKERYNSYLADGTITAYRCHFYNEDEDGLLQYETTISGTKLRKPPRVINKKHDQHPSPIKAKAAEQQEVVALGQGTGHQLSLGATANNAGSWYAFIDTVDNIGTW
jgi:hypothetical protein